MTIDVWMQHPTRRFLASDMLASLRRWTGGGMPADDLPIELTLASMDAAEVGVGLLSAWRGPNGL
ncbi:MAG TPA: amidohydrolase, partial [Solirubrobacterales bacterium]|nr:amidohydrolase [Solirubrobacterales bacterium]